MSGSWRSGIAYGAWFDPVRAPWSLVLNPVAGLTHLMVGESGARPVSVLACLAWSVALLVAAQGRSRHA